MPPDRAGILAWAHARATPARDGRIGPAGRDDDGSSVR